MLRKKGLLFAAAVLVGLVVYGLYPRNRYEPANHQYTGAYRFEDQRLAVLTPSTEERYRLRFYSGAVRTLLTSDAERFDSFDGFSTKGAASTTGRFLPDAIEFEGGETARRIPLSQHFGRFESDGLTLRGKIVLPIGEGVHPLVVLVHGSEDYSAVDYYYMSYFLAAHGFAAVAFDKRGTGESTGEYTQDFQALAGDVVAAVDWAKEHPRVDGKRVNLLGYSQGGWVAPLAAANIEGLQALSIHYGVAVSVAREDRWGYVYALQQKGFGDEALESADAINAVMSRIIEERDPAAWSELATLIDQHRETDWFKAIAGSDSVMGRVAGTTLPMWMWRVYFWFLPKASAQRLWDPAPTLAAIDAPQHWILAEEDSSVPTPETVRVLQRLRAEDRPIDVRTFPDTDHGIVTYKQDESGERTLTGYATEYFSETVSWLKEKNEQP